MLQKLLKRKLDATAAATVPAWHPSFRDYETLPDVKVVRTAFFVNGVAVLVVVALLLWLGYTEYQAKSLRQQRDLLDQQIAREKPASMRAIAQFKKFQAEETKVAAVAAFVASRPALSTIVLRLGETRPPNVALEALEWRDGVLALRASVRGTADAASGYASAYVEQLRGDAVIGPLFDEVSLTSLARNPATGRQIAEFTLKPKPAPAAKK